MPIAKLSLNNSKSLAVAPLIMKVKFWTREATSKYISTQARLCGLKKHTSEKTPIWRRGNITRIGQTYCIPRHILVPREKGANVEAAALLAVGSIQRSGLKRIGSGYNSASVCINSVVIPTGVPAGIRQFL